MLAPRQRPPCISSPSHCSIELGREQRRHFPDLRNSGGWRLLASFCLSVVLWFCAAATVPFRVKVITVVKILKSDQIKGGNRMQVERSG